MKIVTIGALLLATTISTTSMSLFTATAANADSCWDHNGSIMRLKASGQNRWFYYENPRPGLSVSPGTLLFDGSNNGGHYSGNARVFSRFNPDAPLQYHVEGPVSNNQTRVTMRGTREVWRSGQPTGRYKTDTLVFTYQYQC